MLPSLSIKVFEFEFITLCKDDNRNLVLTPSKEDFSRLIVVCDHLPRLKVICKDKLVFCSVPSDPKDKLHQPALKKALKKKSQKKNQHTKQENNESKVGNVACLIFPPPQQF